MLVTLVAWLVHGERLDAPSLVGIGLIAAGAVVLQVFSGGARPCGGEEPLTGRV